MRVLISFECETAYKRNVCTLSKCFYNWRNFAYEAKRKEELEENYLV